MSHLGPVILFLLQACSTEPEPVPPPPGTAPGSAPALPPGGAVTSGETSVGASGAPVT